MLIRKRARESARLVRRGTQASAPPSSAPTRLHWTSRPARLRSPRVTHRRSSSRSSTATSWRPHRRYATSAVRRLEAGERGACGRPQHKRRASRRGL